MKNNKNSYYITLDDISARSTPGAVKVLEGSSGGKMPKTIDEIRHTSTTPPSALTEYHLQSPEGNPQEVIDTTAVGPVTPVICDAPLLPGNPGGRRYPSRRVRNVARSTGHGYEINM